MLQSGGFLGRLLGPLLKTGLPLIKNMIKPLGLTVAASAADAGIYKKILESGNHLSHNNAALMISNDEMKDIIKIVKSLKDSGLSLTRVSETVQNEAKEEKGGFLSILLVTLGANLLGNILTGKGAIEMNQGRVINRAGEEIVRAGCGNKKGQKNNKMDF